jgi:hypothetical protein
MGRGGGAVCKMDWIGCGLLTVLTPVRGGRERVCVFFGIFEEGGGMDGWMDGLGGTDGGMYRIITLWGLFVGGVKIGKIR